MRLFNYYLNYFKRKNKFYYKSSISTLLFIKLHNKKIKSSLIKNIANIKIVITFIFLFLLLKIKMLSNQKLKLKTNTKRLFYPNFSVKTSNNLTSSFLKNIKMKQIKNSKKRNISLIKENISFSINLQKKLNSIFITKILNQNKHSRNKTLISKRKLRNQKIIDCTHHYITELNDNKNSAETTTTATTSKRNFKNINNSNLSKLNCKLTKESFRKIKNKIYNKFNSLKGHSLHFQNKNNIEDDGYIITEESIFNSKNSSNYQNKSNSKKSCKNNSYNSSFDNEEISFTYSDDTDTKRFQNSKRKLNENFDNLNNNVNNNNVYFGRNYLSKNNIKNNYLTCNINKNDLNYENNYQQDFLTFYEEMHRKLFGK